MARPFLTRPCPRSLRSGCAARSRGVRPFASRTRTGTRTLVGPAQAGHAEALDLEQPVGGQRRPPARRRPRGSPRGRTARTGPPPPPWCPPHRPRRAARPAARARGRRARGRARAPARAPSCARGTAWCRAAGWAGPAPRARPPPRARVSSRRWRITRLLMVVSVWSTAPPSFATASKAATPRRPSLRCSSSSANGSERSRLLYWTTSGTRSGERP